MVDLPLRKGMWPAGGDDWEHLQAQHSADDRNFGNHVSGAGHHACAVLLRRRNDRADAGAERDREPLDEHDAQAADCGKRHLVIDQESVIHQAELGTAPLFCIFFSCAIGSDSIRHATWAIICSVERYNRYIERKDRCVMMENGMLYARKAIETVAERDGVSSEEVRRVIREALEEARNHNHQ